jgi:hypothetical protein
MMLEGVDGRRSNDVGGFRRNIEVIMLEGVDGT